MIKAVIFDFDYTLGDSTNGIFISINYALEQLGYAARKRDNIKNTIGLSLKEKVLYVGDSFIDAEAAEKAKVKFIATLTGTTAREDFRKYNCVWIADNLSEVYEYILGRTRKVVSKS